MPQQQTFDSRSEYNRYLAQLGRTPGGKASQDLLTRMGLVEADHRPKFEPALHIISGAIPGFGWKLESAPNGTDVVVYTGYPRVNGAAPSIADLVLYAQGELQLHFDELPPGIASKLKPLMDLGSTGVKFARMLYGIGISIPSIDIVGAIANWLQRVMNGVPSTLFTGVCPDYATKDGRYTFDGLGTGIGIVSGRAVGAVPAIQQFCIEHGFNVNFVVAMGDFEADTPQVCAGVRLTKPEFLNRVRGSQQAVIDRLPGVEVKFATEMGDFYGWLDRCRQEVAADRWSGPIPMTELGIQNICQARSSLYRRWFGEKTDLLTTLRFQAPEYGAMGCVATQVYPNTLIMGADAPSMAPFWQMCAETPRPIFYLRAKDY